MRYNIWVTEGSDFGAGVVGVLIMLALLGSCGDNHSSSKYEDSYTEEIAYTEECSEDSGYVELDYDEEFSESLDSDYMEEECLEGEYAAESAEEASFHDLCFYNGEAFYCLCHDTCIEDCFGGEHDALYNDFSMNCNDMTEDGVFTRRYFLDGKYSKLTFNSGTTCGDPKEYGDITIKLSYNDDCTDEETVWERRIYGATLVEADSIDLSGVTFISITIPPFQCERDDYGQCYALIGDFVLT